MIITYASEAALNWLKSASLSDVLVLFPSQVNLEENSPHLGNLPCHFIFLSKACMFMVFLDKFFLCVLPSILEVIMNLSLQRSGCSLYWQPS